MDRIPFIYKAISDTATITALVMVALFGVMDRMGIKKGTRDPLMIYFAFFSLCLAGYVFFDNSLSLLAFHALLVAKIDTVGVSLCAFGLMLSYSGMISKLFDVPLRNRPWFRLCVILAILSLLCSLTIFLHSWEWYMQYLDAPAIALYGIIFVVIERQLILALRKNRKIVRNTALMLVSIHVMIFSLFFWRVLINIDTANFFFNNSILLGAMALLFPLVISLHRSEEYRELQKLRLEQEERAHLAEQSLRELFRLRGPDSMHLTDREIEVCEALLEGLEYKEIQDRCGLSLGGVKKRVHLLYRKLGVQNRTELYNRVQEMRRGPVLA